jgi:hypothetical protein
MVLGVFFGRWNRFACTIQLILLGLTGPRYEWRLPARLKRLRQEKVTSGDGEEPEGDRNEG